MLKKSILLLSLTFCCVAKMLGQYQCATDQVRQQLIKEHPEVLQFEAQLEKQTKEWMEHKRHTNALGKTTDLSPNDTFEYDIPIVIHIIHDDGVEFTKLSDDDIFNAVDGWNQVYALENPDTAEVIAPFKKYVGNPRIRLHLATKDPHGNPTKGITRRKSYLTHTAGEQAKFDQWPNDAYMNIWFINSMSNANGQAAAYAHLPGDAAAIPFWDGIIARYDYFDRDKTINHEMGHEFNLSHPWGMTNQPEVGCGDDEVDDTPPTKGHNPIGSTVATQFMTCDPSTAPANSPLWDTTCASHYFKVYPSSINGIDSLVDYPDTTNAQNIMDYTYCSRMFTNLQCVRMHAALNSDVAGRSNLWNPNNLAVTGALQPRLDLAPVPDFSIHKAGTNVNSDSGSQVYFTVPSHTVKIINRTQGDTVTNLDWTFSNGATNPTFSSLVSVNNAFTQPGWVTMTMTATGNGANASAPVTSTFDHAIFVADAVGVDPIATGYYQEFNPGADLDKWPMFNYYNNEFKWQTSNYGYYDQTGVMYTGFDNRVGFNGQFYATNTTGTPQGDYDDMFTIPFDLSAYSGTGAACNLSFMFAGATRTSYAPDITDKIEIAYSTDNTNTWKTMDSLTKGQLANNGTVATAFYPTSASQWSAHSVSIPTVARKPYVIFRLRYKPGVGTNSFSSGNNFFMDRFNISQYAAAVANVVMDKMGVSVVPNPTSGNAYVVIKDASNATARINVMDITGKTVYATSAQITGSDVKVEIPQSYISVKGIYLVNVVTGNQTQTEKLVVY